MKGVSFTCPQCDVPFPGQQLYIDEDGEFKLIGICPQCKCAVNVDVFRVYARLLGLNYFPNNGTVQ